MYLVLEKVSERNVSHASGQIKLTICAFQEIGMYLNESSMGRVKANYAQ
jgi:hypothetical protein